MTFKQNFCSSPWLHMRINNTGAFEYCRWAQKHDRNNSLGIQDMSPNQWFQRAMSPLRSELLQGHLPSSCNDCKVMEQHGKVSGRQRQLLKTGVTLENFEKSMHSSPWLQVYLQSWDNQGSTEQLPQDWQIDLGNFCNSACLFCTPHSSSRLAGEHLTLGIIDKMPPRAWTDDDELVNKFLQDLAQAPSLKYLHFIGGETLITPAFKTILKHLIQHKLNESVTIGFTTNLTVWRPDINDLLRQFHSVNLGMSIECLHPVNDYVRYGSELETTRVMLDRWLDLADEATWLPQIRVTPTVLTALHLDTIYQYAIQRQVAVESCNFIDRPEFMRPTVLPYAYRQQVINKLQNIEFGHRHNGVVINTRDRNQCNEQLYQDAQSYVQYLSAAAEETARLPDLVRYLKIMESSRHNNVLDYLPEYEELLRSAGY